jgi:hypothetical protein
MFAEISPKLDELAKALAELREVTRDKSNDLFDSDELVFDKDVIFSDTSADEQIARLLKRVEQCL